MPIFAKPSFTWNEPKEVVSRRREKQNRERLIWERPLVVVSATAFMMGIQTLMRLSPTKELPSIGESLLWATGLGVFLAYIVPWLWRNQPSKYRLFKHALVRDVRGNTRCMDWDQFDGFSLQDFNEFYILSITRKAKGDSLEIAVPTDVVIPALERFMMERGLTNQKSEQDAAPQIRPR